MKMMRSFSFLFAYSDGLVFFVVFSYPVRRVLPQRCADFFSGIPHFRRFKKCPS